MNLKRSLNRPLVMKMVERETLAKWLHDTYEKIAMEVTWKTQEHCRVAFSELPPKNKKVMILLAEALENELPKLGWVRAEKGVKKG